MKTVTANQLKQTCGQVMDQVQREPVLVEKYGRPHAVVVSYEDYLEIERIKLTALKADIAAGIASGDAGPADAEALIAEALGSRPANAAE